MSKNNKDKTDFTSDEEKDVLWKAFSTTVQSDTVIDYSPRYLQSSSYNFATPSLSPSPSHTLTLAVFKPPKDNNSSDEDGDDCCPFHRKSTLEKKRIRME